MKCNQCDSLAINGILCHETGCPNSHIDLSTGELHQVSCEWCGTEFTPDEKGQQFCCEECAESYYL